MPFELPSNERCPFCGNMADPSRSAIVEVLEESLAFVNPRPFGLGHLLVVPRRHAATLLDLNADEAAAITKHVHRLANAISEAFDPSGLNIFQNNGISAGQSVAHYHVHIVPSYPGDPPGRIFHNEDFERVSLEERLEVAASIIARLRS